MRKRPSPLATDFASTRRAPALIIFALAAVACSADRSFALVTVRTSDGELSKVVQLVVDVQNGPHRDQLRYPKTPTASVKIGRTEPVDLSVSFRRSYTGTLKIGVTPLGAGGVPLGYGEIEREIEPGKVMKMDVLVVPGLLPPSPITNGGSDSGAGDGGGAAEDGPALSVCEPTDPATCGVAQTCYVSCRGTAGVGVCIAGGAKKPGEACASNTDCEPGSQCFEYPCLVGGAKPKVCMRFCADDDDCGDGRCFIDVPCGAMATGHRICSQSCDPRGAATGGCTAGLHCFIFPGEVPSCDCRDERRVGDDGAVCQDARDCAPGLLCVAMSGGRVCRPICRLADKDCPAGRTCTKLVEPDYSTWGACLP
jgi:hypothetical protein